MLHGGKMLYLTYRSNSQLIDAIRASVQHFYAQRRCLPGVIAVNPTARAEAQAAVDSLQLRVPLQTVGGCLLGEVWLGVKEQ